MHSSLMRRRFERIGLVFGIMLAIFIIVVVINRVLQSDQGPLEPSPQATSPPTIGPTLAPGTATPEAIFDSEPAPEPGSLLHMLGYAPDRLQDNSLPLSDIAQYADIQRWMSSRGIDTPTGSDDPAWDAWNAELANLAIPEILATRGTDDVWMQTYGFGLHQVHQVLAVGSAPDLVLVLRGDFDENTLHTTWAENGYQAVRVDGVTYWSLYPGGSVDLSAPASRPALGNMNNVALLEDGTLIATARSSRLEQTVRTTQGSESSLAANDDLQTLLTPGINSQQFVTAVILRGSVLEAPISSVATPVAATPVPEVPQADLLLAGLQLLPDNDARVDMVMVTSYDSAESATAAYFRAYHELASGRSTVTDHSYRARVNPGSMRVVASEGNESLLFLQITLNYGTVDWLEIIEQRDLGYLMWPRGS